MRCLTLSVGLFLAAVSLGQAAPIPSGTEPTGHSLVVRTQWEVQCRRGPCNYRQNGNNYRGIWMRHCNGQRCSQWFCGPNTGAC